MNNFDYKDFLEKIEEALKSYLPSKDCTQSKLIEAMEYGLLGGGKRIRALLTTQFCILCGEDRKMALPFACALEMIHAYSLIHDDLPCMDDDDMRRGKPSCHAAFGESTALLAGDALQALAFDTMLTNYDKEKIPHGAVLQAALELAKASGALGMCGGQAIDLESENKEISIDELNELHQKKTGALFIAAGKIGSIIAGADKNRLNAAEEYCSKVGLAFQIIDDILDYTGNEQELGKSVGKDKKQNKSTYVTLLGTEESFKIARKLTNQAIGALKIFGDKADFLINLAESLIDRNF